MPLILTNDALVLRAFAVLANAAPSNIDFAIHKAYIKDYGTSGYITALNDIFANVSDAQLANILLANTGLDTVDLEGDGNTDNTAIATAFIAANASNRVGAMLDLTKAMQQSTIAPAAAFNANFDAAYAYATNSVNVTGRAFDGTVDQILTTGMDSLTGGALNDYFKAYMVGNSNTLASGDVLDGGTGSDTLYADIAPNTVVISAQTKGIENVLFRVQAEQSTSGDNNMYSYGIIDAERMKDVLNWENNNSRADLVIEDVRINDNQITKDITITMRETDPGQVDYAVYFDQNSLRNTTENASQMNLRVLDTYAVAQGKDALLDSPYGAFTFYVKVGSADAAKVKLESQAMQDAKTLGEMVTAMQAAADAYFGANVVTVTLGSTYTVKDSVTGNDVTGNEIVIAAKSSGSSNITFSTPTGSGWLATETVPAISGLYTSFTTGATSSNDLVTSTVVLDYVGRGSNGGDLVIGGLSVGDTSTSKGVQRFEITVEDDSRLQTINSTSNTLKEVTIKNGTQDRISDAYYKVDEKGGLLSVLGNDGTLGKGTPYTAVGTEAAAMPGTAAQHNEYGFSDVRLIDGSEMTGKLSFDAEITQKSIDKYLNKTDTANSYTADNVAFVYSGGSNNDSMYVSVDGSVAASTNTLTAREDFTITLNGGAGNDAISVTIDSASGSATNWYGNQSQYNNVIVNGGDGNDTVKTLSSGDFVINAGSGNDTVYIGNEAAKSVWTVSNSATIAVDTNNLLGIAADASAVFLAGGKLTVTYSAPGIAAVRSGGVMGSSNTTGVTVDASGIGTKLFANGLEVTVDIPTGDNYAVTQYHVNQAIKNAINNDAVLSKFLLASDGPGTSLIITSLVDGLHVASDLLIEVYRDAAYTAANTEIVSAYQTFSKNSTATLADANTAADASTDAINAREGMADDTTVPGGVHNFRAGVNSLLVSDNVIDLGAGEDVLVLSTTIGGTALASSNETVKFTATSGIDSTIANFTVGDVATVFGADKLDFTQYLTSKTWHAGSSSTASQVRIATDLDTGTTVTANSVHVIVGTAAAFTTTNTFANLTAELFKSAINTSGTNYAGLDTGDLNAKNDYTTSSSTGLVDNAGKAIVLVENTQNLGEYKVFELGFKGQATTNADANFDTVTLLGVVDFGASLTGLVDGNLV